MIEQKFTAEELLNLLKENKEEELNFYIIDSQGKIVWNEDTGNYMGLFSYDRGFLLYGCYGHLFKGGQVDNRYQTDEEILAEIKKAMQKGTIITSEELSAKIKKDRDEFEEQQKMERGN